MFLALGDPPAVWREEMATLDQQIADTNRDLARARDVSDAPQNLSIVHDRPLLVRIGQILDADIGVQQDQLYRARSVAITTPSVDTTQTEARLEAQQVQLNRLKFAFQQDPTSLADPSIAGDAKSYLARTIDRLGGNVKVEGLVQQYAARKRVLDEPASTCTAGSPPLKAARSIRKLAIPAAD